MKKGLYIVATPIGNLSDISSRAIEVLNASEIIACEDTRVTKKLFSLLGISLKKKFIPLHDHNEDNQAQAIIDLSLNNIVSLVSDAGSPLISDPGFKLIRKCREQNVYFTVVPGACALVCALQLSGLPTNRFMFSGFIPNKDKGRHDLFQELKDINATLVFYETAPRLIKSLNAAKEVLGNREFAVAREISKIYEECRTGSAEDLIDYYTKFEPKGEIVLMISPPKDTDKAAVDIEQLLSPLLVDMSLKSAVKQMVETYNLNKNEVYEIALKLKRDLNE